MTRFIFGMALAFSSITTAVAADPADRHKPAAEVTCHGKLRHNVVAIGAETTGTTISFGGLTWELKLPDTTRVDFAKNHHRRQVTVVGTLRKVEGIERPVRWIVEVSELTESDANVKDNETMMTVSGILKKDASGHGTADWSVVTETMSWPLDLSKDATLRSTADALASMSVKVTGQVQCSKTKEPHAVVVATTIEAIPATTSK